MKLGRLGRMAYINTLPVDWGLVRGNFGDLIRVRRGVPTELNRLLSEGQLDVSPVASVAAARHASEWLVLDHLCIGCRGEVGSVILQSECPVTELDGCSLAVSSESATAARLLAVLLQVHWRVKAHLVSDDRHAKARLLIGDAALKAALSSKDRYVYDLGSAWKDYSGTDFIFGLWCIRKTFAEQYPDKAHALYQVLKLSRCIGKVAQDQVIAQGARIAGLGEVHVKDYFRKLVYEPDDGLWTGLHRFLGLIGYDPGCLEFFGEPKGRAMVPTKASQLPLAPETESPWRISSAGRPHADGLVP